MKHESVLLDEVLTNLHLNDTSLIVDCTLGYGGHSSYILKRIKSGHLFAFDQDAEAIKFASDRLSEVGDNFTIIKSNFINLKSELNKLNITKVDGILFDLGVSSPQLDDGSRGFSYHQDAPLDMRMDQDSDLSAYDVVNTYSFEDLMSIFYKYGEEKYAKSIAKGIINSRPINTTFELVDVIKNNTPVKYHQDKHPGRKVFQAIRIEVNKELDVITPALEQATELLAVNGYLAVITFHSLEAKLVKNFFKRLSSIPSELNKLPSVPEEYLPKFELITKKSIKPSDEELNTNNRSRSASLHVLKRIKED